MSAPAAAPLAEALDRARAMLDDAERIVMTTHVQPDGDGIGSESALATWLRARGKRVTIVNPHATPRRFAFLEPDPPIVAFEPAAAEEALAEADLLVVLDISTPERLGRLGPLVERFAPATLVIDHHRGPSGFVGFDVRDERAAATAELVYRLLAEDDPEAITSPIATALYAAIVYDTGGFRYANTTVRTHEIAADLIRRGAESTAVNQWVFDTLSMARVRLLARVLTSFETSADGRVAWASIGQPAMDEVGAANEDVEGIVESLRSIEGVDVAILFKEVGPDATKVSLRSVGAADVHAFASGFGGGGHRNASGILVGQPMRLAVDRVVRAALETFAAGGPAAGTRSSGGGGG